MMSSTINDFKSKLNGLLTSLHTLSSSDQKVAVSLLSSTLSAELCTLSPFATKAQKSSLFANIESCNKSCKKFKRDAPDSCLQAPLCSLTEELEGNPSSTDKRDKIDNKLSKKRISGESIKNKSLLSSGLVENSSKNDLQHNWFEPNKLGTILLSQPQEIFSRSQTCTPSSETCISLKENKTQSQEKRALFEKIFHASQSGANCKHLQLSVLKSSAIPPESVRVVSRKDPETLSPGLKVVKLQEVSLKSEGRLSPEVSTSSSEGPNTPAKNYNAPRETVPTEPIRITFSNQENSQEELATNKAHQQTSLSFSQGICARAETVHAHVQATTLPQQTKHTCDKIMQAQQQTTISLQCHESLHSMVYQISSSNDVSYRSWGKIQAQALGVQAEENISQIQGSLPQTQECFAPSTAGVSQVTDGSLIKVNSCDASELINNAESYSLAVASSSASLSSSLSYDDACLEQENLVIDQSSNRSDDIDCSVQPSPLALDKYSMARDLREATETLEKSFSSLKEQQQWHLQQQTLVFTDPLCDHIGSGDEVVCRRSLQGVHENEALDHAAPSYTQRATQLLDHSLRVLGFNQTTRECGLDVLVTSHFDLPSDFSEVLDYSMQAKSEKLIEEEMPTDLSVDHEFDLKPVSGAGKIIEVTNVLNKLPETESVDEVNQPTDLSLSNMCRDKYVLADHYTVRSACSSSGCESHKEMSESDWATKESQSGACVILHNGLFLDEPAQHTMASDDMQQEQSIVWGNTHDCLTNERESMHRKGVKRKNGQMECIEKDASISSSELINFGVQDVVYDLSLPPAVNSEEKTFLCDSSCMHASPPPHTHPVQMMKKTEILSLGDFPMNLDVTIPDYGKNFSISTSSVDNDLHCDSAQSKASNSPRATKIGTSCASRISTVASTTGSTEEYSLKMAAIGVIEGISESRDEPRDTLKTSNEDICQENMVSDVEHANVTSSTADENVPPAYGKFCVTKGKGKKIIKGKTSIKSKKLCMSLRKAAALKAEKRDVQHSHEPGEEKFCETELQDKRAYLCEICDIEFVHKVTYVRHMRGHSSNKCSLCPSSFSSNKALRHHSLVSHNTSIRAKTYDCPLCWRSFTKRVLLHSHTARQHAVQGMHVCRKCGDALPSTSALQQHMQDHSSSELPCSLCSASFSRRQTLLIHMKGHERNSCRECGAACSSSKQLMAHCRRAHLLLDPQSPRRKDLHDEYGDSNKSLLVDMFPGRESLGNSSATARAGDNLRGVSKFSSRPCIVRQRNSKLKKQVRRSVTTKGSPIVSKNESLDGVSNDAGNGSRIECASGYVRQAMSDHISPVNVFTPHNAPVRSQNHPHEYNLKSITASAAVRYGDSRAASPKFTASPRLVRPKFRAPPHVFGRMHSCPQCPRQFGRPSLLREHITTHSGESAFRCERCNKKFATRSGHRKHLASAQHLSSRPRGVLGGDNQSCTISENTSVEVPINNSLHAKAETFSSQKDDSSHLSSSNSREEIERVADDSGSFGLHEAGVTIIKDTEVMEVGGMPVASDVDLAPRDSGITSESTGSDARLVESGACKSSAVSETSNVPTPVLELTTDNAGSAGALEGNYSVVRRRAASPFQTVPGKKHNFTCNFCDYMTNSKFCIKRHIDTHFNRRRFVCEACGKAFLSLLNLQDHHAFMHSNEKRFTCSHCSHSFKTRSSLVRHLQKHSTEKPYQCHCGNKYKRLSYLKRHKLSAHNEISKVRNLIKFSAMIHLSNSDSKNRIIDELARGSSGDPEQKSVVLSTHHKIDVYNDNSPSNVACNVNLLPKVVGGTPEVLDLTHNSVPVRNNDVDTNAHGNGVVILRRSESLNSLPLVRDPSNSVLFDNLPCVKMTLPSQSDQNFLTKSEGSDCPVTRSSSRVVPEVSVASSFVSLGPASQVVAAHCSNPTAVNCRVTGASPSTPALKLTTLNI